MLGSLTRVLYEWGEKMKTKTHEEEMGGNVGGKETDRESKRRNSCLVFISVALSQPVN